MESVIYNDNCFNKFASIADKSVQLVVVDLPYEQTSLKWDTCIDLNKMWIELKRILKPNGQVLFFCTTKFGYKLIASNEKWFRSDIVWDKVKGSSFLLAKKCLMKSHEMIYLFHNPTKPKNMNWIYNPQMVEGKPYSKGTMVNSKVHNIISNEFVQFKNDGVRYPKSIYTHHNIIKGEHSTQKPVALCEWLIKTYSNEGDVVMDFTMGSGSTIIACINTNRKYIGIEKDNDIFLTAEKRIQERNDLIKTNKDLVIN